MIKTTQERRLLLISRDDILGASERQGQHIYRLLAWFGRHGYHLLATAPQGAVLPQPQMFPASKPSENTPAIVGE